MSSTHANGCAPEVTLLPEREEGYMWKKADTRAPAGSCSGWGSASNCEAAATLVAACLPEVLLSGCEAWARGERRHPGLLHATWHTLTGRAPC